MLLETTINNYLNNSKLVKSAGTYDYELKHLKSILNYFNYNDIKYTYDLSKDKINNMIIYFREKNNCCNKTINKKINLLKRVLIFNNIDNDYLLKFNKLKERKKRFDILKGKDLKNLLNYISKFEDFNPIELSEKLIILIFLDTGIRVNELLHIEINNINIDENYILLTKTKNNFERIVFFTHLTKNLLIQYINLLPKRKYLFWNYRINKRYNYDNVRDLFNRIKNKLNLLKFHPHMLRHTMATLYIENGGKIEFLQRILGHTSLKTTEIYLHLSVKNVKEDYFNNYKY